MDPYELTICIAIRKGVFGFPLLLLGVWGNLLGAERKSWGEMDQAHVVKIEFPLKSPKTPQRFL